MAQISLSKRENDFLRYMLICSMRHYTCEIEDYKILLSSCKDDDMIEFYENMLRSDKSRLSYAKDLYSRFLALRDDDPDLENFPNICNE